MKGHLPYIHDAHSVSTMLELPELERNDDVDADSALEYLREARRQTSSESCQDLESAVELHSRMSVLGDQIGGSPTQVVVSGPGIWKRRFVHLFGVRDFLSIKEQWVQVVAAIILGVALVYCDCLAQVYLQQTVADGDTKREQLFDMGFKLSGPQWVAPEAADSVLMIFAVVTIIRYIIIPGPYSMRWTIVRRYIICVGMLFLLRGMSIIATVLPNPDKYCVASIHPVRPGSTEDWGMFVLAWGIFIGSQGTCADVLFSGHTVNLTLCLLIWYDYARLCPIFTYQENRWYDKLHIQRVVVIVYALFAYYVIIKTRFHYTVDVWIGFWMTYFVWSYYHEAIKASPFHRGRLMRFLTWLEKHATDLRYWRIRVANQFVYDEELRRFDPETSRDGFASYEMRARPMQYPPKAYELATSSMTQSPLENRSSGEWAATEGNSDENGRFHIKGGRI